MSLAAVIIAGFVAGAQIVSFYCLWLLNEERKRFHKRLNVQRKELQILQDSVSNKTASLYDAIGAASSAGSENNAAILVKLEEIAGSKPTADKRSIPPRTLTQAKREAEQRLAQLAGVAQ